MKIEKLTENEKKAFQMIQKNKQDGFIINDIKNNQTEVEFNFAKIEYKRTVKFELKSSEMRDYIKGYIKLMDSEFEEQFLRLDDINYARAERIKPKRIKGYVTIDNIVFDEVYLIHFGKTKKINQDEGMYFTFTMNLSKKVAKKVKKIDFRKNLSLYSDENKIFVGKVEAFIINDIDSMTCYCKIPELNFYKKDINEFSGDEKALLDMKKFLIDYYNANEIFPIEETHTEERTFLVEMGFKGIEIPEYLKIGDCSIQKPGENVAIYEFFPDTIPRMVMNLESTSYMDAIKKTRFYFQNAINLMNFRNKIPIFLDKYISKDIIADIALLSQIFIRDIKYMGNLAMDYPIKNVQQFKKKHLLQDHFKPIQKLAYRYCNPRHELSEKDKLEIWIFHFLNLAEITQDPIVAFLHLWTAIEFLVNRFWTKSTKSYNKAEKRIFTEYISQFSEYLEKNKLKINFQNTSFTEFNITTLVKRVNEINEIFGEKLNAKSFRVKLFEILKDVELDLNEEEIQSYDNAREKRNDIIHGHRNEIPTKEEFNLISKIIYQVLREKLLPHEIKI